MTTHIEDVELAFWSHPAPITGRRNHTPFPCRIAFGTLPHSKWRGCKAWEKFHQLKGKHISVTVTAF